MALDFNVTDKENHAPIIHRNEAFLQLTGPQRRQPQPPLAPPIRSHSLEPYWNDNFSNILAPVSTFAPLPPAVVKIITPGKDAEKIPDELLNKKKKVFADSSFYCDPGHNYPTVEEQRKMAHHVAQSLTAAINQQTRGHQMFMKRKETHDENDDDDDVMDHATSNANDVDRNGSLYYNPTPWKSTKQWIRGGAEPATASSSGGTRPRSTTPSSRVYAVASVIPDSSLTDDASGAMSADELERFRLFADKSKHDSVPPQICFSLANDLRESNSRGARMFAKRRARADQFTIENSPPQLVTLEKIAPQNKQNPSNYQPQPVTTPTSASSWIHADAQQQKSRWTPWDAAIEFGGNVEPAFEHLSNATFVAKPDAFQSNASLVPSTTRHQTPVQQTSVMLSSDNGRRPTMTSSNWSHTAYTNLYRPVNFNASVK